MVARPWLVQGELGAFESDAIGQSVEREYHPPHGGPTKTLARR